MKEINTFLLASGMLLFNLVTSACSSANWAESVYSTGARAVDTLPPLKLVKKPIAYTAERKKLSLEYMADRHGIIQSTPRINPCMVVVHYTGGGTMNSNFNYFSRLYIEDGRPYNKKQSPLNVSAHYLVDTDGTVYQLVEDTLFARHTIGLNYCAIGIENVGGSKKPLTQAQAIANAQLIRQLSKKFPIKYVIGHSEYGAFKKTNMWKEKDPNYFTHKQDPGEAFLKQIREMNADLKLKSAPDKDILIVK